MGASPSSSPLGLLIVILPLASPKSLALERTAPRPPPPSALSRLQHLSSQHAGAPATEAPLYQPPALRLPNEHRLAPAEANGAMPFVSIDAINQTLSVHSAALHALATAPAPICVLSVAGGAQEGKSAWLNMFSQWLRERWPTVGAADTGANFKVGRSIFDDDATQGAWLRLFTGQDGRPLPGTECTSLALIDTQGPPRSLRLGSGDGEDAATPGAHKLFSLATLASSTVALNVMTPLLNQLGQLAPMLRDASTSLLESPRAFAGEPANLVVLERDVLRAAASTDVLEYAWLEPRGDALDAARATLRRLYNNRTLVQMAPPDAADLDALGRGEMPSQHRLRNLPLSGPRPFYAHFEAAAAAVVGALIPKSLGGQPLHGRELAEALSALSTELSEGRPASLAAAVHGSLRAQAQEAATAGVRAGVLALRRLLPSADALADGPTTRDAVESLDDAAGAAAGAAPLRVPSVALVSASSLELALRNATNTALAEFARLAPRYGSSARGEPAPWLEPYVTSVLSELGALERGARHAHAHAQRVLVLHRRERRLLESARDAEASFEAKVEARVAERVQQALAGMGLGADRLADRIDAGADRPPSLDDAGREAATAASGYVAHDGDGRYDASSAVPLPSPQMRQELVSHLLLLAVGTSAAVCPPAALVKLAPLMASAPTFFALMGIYRLAQRPIVRASDYLVRSVRAVGAAISGAATQLAEHAAESGFGQQLVCGHGLRAAPC